ncbi:MAG: hypothetical protein M3M99_04290, partial [Actinomycetota bacterium]|nr:hypothetical protein [Actinomycetota bacterium]
MAEVGAGGSGAAIVFCGFMAAGKSAAARASGDVLGAEPVDADVELERQLGEPIASFFEREGEPEFRRREEELVLGLLDRAGSGEGPNVIALGGGAVESERVRQALAGQLTVWCHVDEET